MPSTPETLVHQIEHWARQKPHAVALRGQRDGQYYAIPWSEYWLSVREVAKGLIALGHQPGESIAIVGPNEPQWVQYEFGIQAARGVPAPLYPNNTPDQMAYIINNARAKIAIFADAVLIDKLLEAEATGQCAKAEKILTFYETDHPDPRVMTFDAVRKLGREQDDTDLDERLAALQPDETCMLIYTSGTTGMPKGVMLTHAGQLTVGRSMLEVYTQFSDGKVPYRVVSYLPLSHQAEQIVTNVLTLATGGEVTFCPRMENVKDFLLHVRPTVFLGMPRVWEKFQAALEARLKEATGWKARLATWARETELEWAEREFEKGEVRPSVRRRIAQALVIDKVKEGLGLDQLEVAATGSAPIAQGTMTFFASIGICLHDAYGVTETSGLTSVTPTRRPVSGAVGKPLSCIECRIASDGEILLRGPIVTKGYLRLPKETEALFTEDGWMRTGDLGSLGDDGYLRITGRKKEILITAGGKNVAPVELENLIKAIEGVGQVIVVGERRPYLAALITLDVENLAALADKAGTNQADLGSMANDPKVRDYLQREIERGCNAKVARYQTIKRFTILANEWTPEGGEVTPTTKLRRGPICEKYEAEIDAMYAAADKGPRASM